jgi:hypothetical protein
MNFPRQEREEAGERFDLWEENPFALLVAKA